MEHFVEATGESLEGNAQEVKMLQKGNQDIVYDFAMGNINGMNEEEARLQSVKEVKAN